MLPLILLALLLTAAAALISVLSGDLPGIVAVHFNAAGVANGFMTREHCRSFMLISTLGAPLFVAAVTGLIPRLLPPSMINIPNRGYWLAPDRAKDSIAFLSEQGIWFACILLVFLASVDWLLARANLSSPPSFPAAPFTWIMAAFACAIALWALRMFRRFRAGAERR
jgi:hypothetical protein